MQSGGENSPTKRASSISDASPSLGRAAGERMESLESRIHVMKGTENEIVGWPKEMAQRAQATFIQVSGGIAKQRCIHGKSQNGQEPRTNTATNLQKEMFDHLEKLRTGILDSQREDTARKPEDASNESLRTQIITEAA